MTIVHVSEVDIREETGMGRVAWHWRKAFRERGHDFLEIGPAQMGRVPHKALQPFRAYQASRRQGRTPDVYLVHEPLAGAFVDRGAKTVVVSHGLERRRWELLTNGYFGEQIDLSLRTRIFFPLWRLRSCDTGIRKADLTLLINSEDAAFAEDFYGLTSRRYRVFKNGVHPSRSESLEPGSRPCRILFLGTWCSRKGTRLLSSAARVLFQRGIQVNWLLAGTGIPASRVLEEWPAELKSTTEVRTHFKRAEEGQMYDWCDIFVLPSLYEGQPLALLQAMEAGRCCVVSGCCGQKDLITDAGNGLLHRPGDAADLADRLEVAIRNPHMRVKLGQAAKASVADRRWETVSAEVVSLVEHAMGSASSGL